MAMKARSTGRTASENAAVGLWQTRSRAGQATGLSRGTATVSSGKAGVVGKTKYKLNSRGNTTYQ
ncbi:hypothetical protein HZA99_01440 [Candidatus Woesearchaeota archaeon]|nr:hypothetical protein [Candidatus Woesearchaeota archaeon]